MGTSTVTAAERSGQVHSWSRVVTLDFVRGIAMILMAIDHVRVYSGVPPGGPTPGIFFTRWVTHFVAPTFVFLAGTAAYLHGRKLADRAARVTQVQRVRIAIYRQGREGALDRRHELPGQ